MSGDGAFMFLMNGSRLASRLKRNHSEPVVYIQHVGSREFRLECYDEKSLKAVHDRKSFHLV
jgi:hypothetical protein